MALLIRLPRCSGTDRGGRMRLVLRMMAAWSLIVMAYATQVSAQTGFANIVDHLHLAAPDPIKAAEWYRKNLGGQPTAEGTDRLMFGDTRVIFQRNEKSTPSAGSVVDHIGFSVKDVDAAMKAMEADGAKIEGPAREVAGLFKLGFVVDRSVLASKSCRTPAGSDCTTFTCVGRIRMLPWRGTSISSAAPSAK